MRFTWQRPADRLCSGNPPQLVAAVNETLRIACHVVPAGDQASLDFVPPFGGGLLPRADQPPIRFDHQHPRRRVRPLCWGPLVLPPGGAGRPLAQLQYSPHLVRVGAHGLRAQVDSGELLQQRRSPYPSPSGSPVQRPVTPEQTPRVG